MHRRAGQRRLARLDAAGAEPRHPAHPSRAASGRGAARRRPACRIIGDIELLYRAHADGALCRHHRHQRQVDHHGADRPHPAPGRQAGAGRRQPRHAALCRWNRCRATASMCWRCRSYQLELTPSALCDVAILLNITPDHLDRHGGMDGYIAAKALIFATERRGKHRRHRRRRRTLPRAVRRARRTPARKLIPISVEREVQGGVYALNGMLVDRIGGAAEPIIDLKTIAHPARQPQLAERRGRLRRQPRPGPRPRRRSSPASSPIRAWRTARS